MPARCQVGCDGGGRSVALCGRRTGFANIDPAFNSNVRRGAHRGILQVIVVFSAVIEFAAFEALRGALEEANVTLINLSTLD